MNSQEHVAFLLWSQVEKPKICEREPMLRNAEITRILRRMWKMLSESSKTPYIEEAESLRLLHLEKHPGNSRPKAKPRKTNARDNSSPTASIIMEPPEPRDDFVTEVSPRNNRKRSFSNSAEVFTVPVVKRIKHDADTDISHLLRCEEYPDKSCSSPGKPNGNITKLSSSNSFAAPGIRNPSTQYGGIVTVVSPSPKRKLIFSHTTTETFISPVVKHIEDNADPEICELDFTLDSNREFCDFIKFSCLL